MKPRTTRRRATQSRSASVALIWQIRLAKRRAGKKAPDDEFGLGSAGDECLERVEEEVEHALLPVVIFFPRVDGILVVMRPTAHGLMNDEPGCLGRCGRRQPVPARNIRPKLLLASNFQRRMRWQRKKERQVL